MFTTITTAVMQDAVRKAAGSSHACQALSSLHKIARGSYKTRNGMKSIRAHASFNLFALFQLSAKQGF